MTLLHIIGGLAGLASGAVALSTRKGWNMPLLCTPVLLVLLLMVYWLPRLLFTQ